MGAFFAEDFQIAPSAYRYRNIFEIMVEKMADADPELDWIVARRPRRTQKCA